MEEQALSLEERRNIRHLRKTEQLLMATNLIAQLVQISPDLKMDEMMMLDALGCAGLSLTIGDDASRTFIELLVERSSSV
ncbi:hypothetical protein UFOVP658_21 [uncultured Caudovirales phage]|uniref:Uncharacterized protein n=1 Tax=uncultured Caudovirales phage TaxID=2100421 RepID=A0A6J5N9U9_9CAUD|nr:hypothetical protein UFOVP658_21 [uncultured Caudovirales phage]